MMTALARAVARASRPKLTVVRNTSTSLARRRIATRDEAYQTFDRATVDSTGAFLVGELERLDPTLHMPLAAVTWSRDIDLREDVSMADEDSSFTNSNFAVQQGVAGSNKSWASKGGDVAVNLGLDIGKTIQPLPVWQQELSWTILELASAQKLGRPVDMQKLDMMQLKYQMDVDEQVYVGEPLFNMNGMLNHAAIWNTGNAINGNWVNATPAQILADVNQLLSSVWAATGYSLMPTELRLDPTSFAILVSTLISSAGNISVLEFLLRNNLARSANIQLNIQPIKWLLGTNNGNPLGVAATNSMYAYIKDQKRIRFPIVPLQRTPLEWRGIRQIVNYYGRLGATELVYPDTVGRRSNLG